MYVCCLLACTACVPVRVCTNQYTLPRVQCTLIACGQHAFTTHTFTYVSSTCFLFFLVVILRFCCCLPLCLLRCGIVVAFAPLLFCTLPDCIVCIPLIAALLMCVKSEHEHALPLHRHRQTHTHVHCTNEHTHTTDKNTAFFY